MTATAEEVSGNKAQTHSGMEDSVSISSEGNRGRGIDIPVTVNLNDNGMNFFIRSGHHLAKLKDLDSEDTVGFKVQRIHPESIQKLIFQDYISTIELEISNVSKHRSEIIDCSKLVTYGMLYRYCSINSFNSLLGSDLIKLWNRNNPKKIIDRRTRLGKATVQRLIEQNKAAYHAIRGDICRPITSRLQLIKPDLTDIERRNLRLFCTRLIDMLNPFVWFLLITHRTKPEYPGLVRRIQIGIQDVVEKSKVADFLAFMIIELLNTQETYNIDTFVRSNTRKDPASKISIRSYDERVKVLREIEEKGVRTFLSWRLKSRNDSFGTGVSLHVSIYNRKSRFGDLEKKMIQHSGLAVSERSLRDFYQDKDASGGGSDLGLYYLSFLQDACREVGVRFESFVNRANSRDLTVMNIIIRF